LGILGERNRVWPLCSTNTLLAVYRKRGDMIFGMITAYGGNWAREREKERERGRLAVAR